MKTAANPKTPDSTATSSSPWIRHNWPSFWLRCRFLPSAATRKEKKGTQLFLALDTGRLQPVRRSLVFPRPTAGAQRPVETQTPCRPFLPERGAKRAAAADGFAHGLDLGFRLRQQFLLRGPEGPPPQTAPPPLVPCGPPGWLAPSLIQVPAAGSAEVRVAANDVRVRQPSGELSKKKSCDPFYSRTRRRASRVRLTVRLPSSPSLNGPDSFLFELKETRACHRRQTIPSYFGKRGPHSVPRLMSSSAFTKKACLSSRDNRGTMNGNAAAVRSLRRCAT